MAIVILERGERCGGGNSEKALFVLFKFVAVAFSHQPKLNLTKIR
jgi:hypothetical protein